MSKNKIVKTAINLLLLITCLQIISVNNVFFNSQVLANERLSTIRDAETERFIKNISINLLRAAKYKNKLPDIILINSATFNAFVSEGERIFINIGVISKSSNYNEIAGVIAHEIGHLIGGHVTRLRQQIKNAERIAIVGILLGTGLAVLEATSNRRNEKEAHRRTASDSLENDPLRGASAVASGSIELAQRYLLKYRREEEKIADVSGAKLLEKAKESPKGMLAVFKRLSRDTLRLSSDEIYKISHPTPVSRINNLQNIVNKSKYKNRQLNSALTKQFLRIKAKIIGYTAKLNETIRLYPKSSKNINATYARAVAYLKYKNYSQANQEIKKLLRNNPKDPYFLELAGQLAIENKNVSEALTYLNKSLNIIKKKYPNQSDEMLIRILIAQALVEKNNKKDARKALRQISRVIGIEKESINGFIIKSRAHYILQQFGQADLSIAQARYYSGKRSEANRFAKRAISNLPKNSVAIQKAKDIIQFTSTKKNKKTEPEIPTPPPTPRPTP